VQRAEAIQARVSVDNTSAGPVTLRQRITSLDVLRGFALLGILMLNIEDFSGPEFLHDIPIGTAQPAFVGWHAGLDAAQLLIKWLFFEGKMRTLFSMLYGAGIVLITERFERRGEPGRAADIFCRRNLWLLLFGVIHGTLIWGGDILAQYALLALLLMFPFRHVSARRVILLGAAVGIVGGTFGAFRGFGIPHTLAQEQLRAAGQAALDQHRAPSPEQRAALDEAAKAPEKLAKDAAEAVRVGRLPYLQSIAPRATGYLDFLTLIFRSGYILEIAGSMLLGMGLYKSGFLTGTCSTRTYLLTAAIGYAISMPIVLGGILRFVHDGFTIISATRWIYVPYMVEIFPAAVANAAVLLLIVRLGWLQPATRALANVGRTAFSNYIGTSLLCQTLFCWGPWKLFGQLAYHQQLPVIAGVWTVNLIASALWLRFFAYGPLEWAWRSLLYWQRQPLRRAATPLAAPSYGV
jgi:uncharacterized protein